MKRLIALVLAAVALFAVAAQAQQPSTIDVLGDVVAQGKQYQSAAAIDTVHSGGTKPSTVAATKWRGPIPIYKVGKKLDPTEIEMYAVPNAWFMYARKPFTFKGMFPNGDSTGTYSTAVDTVIANTHNAYSLHTYPVFYLLKSPVKQLRFDPASSDTVYCVPYVVRN